MHGPGILHCDEKSRWELSSQVRHLLKHWLGWSACCPALCLASLQLALMCTGRCKVTPMSELCCQGCTGHVYGTFWAADLCHTARADELEGMLLVDADKGKQSSKRRLLRSRHTLGQPLQLTMGSGYSSRLCLRIVSAIQSTVKLRS